MNTSSIGNLAAYVSAPVAAASELTKPDQRALIQAVKAVNAAELLGQNNELNFVVDRNTHRAVVRIVNRETREVIQQIPDEYVLRLAEQTKTT